MPESSLLALIVGSLSLVAGWLIRNWARTWRDRVMAQDKRLDEHDTKHTKHDVHHAEMKANLEHIRATADETRKDVKELLRQNGKRNTG